MKTYEQIKEFLESLPIDKDIVNSININMIDQNNPFDSIFNLLSSINLAGGYGLSIYDINAITLATILPNDKRLKDFYNLRNQIEDFFRVNNYFEN